MSGSSLHDERIVTSEETSKEERERIVAEDHARLAEMSDDDIDFSDIPPTTPEQWARAIPNPFYRPPEGQVMLPLDRDVALWFRQTNENYLAAINAALREYMERNRKAS